MAVRLVCRVCGKRLKLPDGLTAKRAAKCPKCLAPVDLTPALEASTYRPTAAIPGMTTVPPKPVPLLGHDDPLPIPSAPKGPLTVTKVAPPPPARPPQPQSAPPKPPPLLGADDPLPRAPAKPPASAPPPKSAATTVVRPPPPNPDPHEVLSLDEEADAPPDAPAEPAPFRVPVRVLANSVAAVVGRCDAVLLPHGLYLEHEPMKPFLYVPPGVVAESPGPGEVTVALPDGRSVTFRFQGRSGRALARDTRRFLAGERPVPAAADYRRKWWMLWAALVFALGPLVLSQTVNLNLKFGLQVGAGLAAAGFLANALVVLFSRRGLVVQTLVMAAGGALVTGAFLFVATAYMAGRQEGAEQAKPEPPAPQPPPAPDPKPPEAVPDRPPSHVDRAKKNGSSALEDGPAEVTALALAPDGKTLGIGYADGTTQLWPFDQPTFDAMLPGPKADGPVSRVQFDAKGLFVFAHAATGAIAAPRGAAALAPAKLPGSPVAVAPELDGERVRFAAVRGNTIQHRTIASAFVQTPKATKGYALPGKGDEVSPLTGKDRDPNRPNNLTFLAWGPGNRLFAGQPDGTISIWSLPMRAEPPSRDHKAAVRAWAECAATGAFATGDDAGTVGVWSAKGGKPAMAEKVLATGVTGLAFSASGSRLAVTDATGWLVILDPAANRAVHRIKRPTAVRAVAFGPSDDVVALAVGKTVEVWWVPKLLAE